jgi:hypothetical protein
MKTVFSTLLLFILGFSPLQAQLDSLLIFTDLSTLSSDDYGGSRLGTEGHKMAQEYMQQIFSK